MIKVLRLNGRELKEKLSWRKEKKSLWIKRITLFGGLINGERDRILVVLMKMFSRLRFEDLEEVYSDATLVLWNKWNNGDIDIKDKTIINYLVMVCRNIAMHYLRNVNDNVESLDKLIARAGDNFSEADRLMNMYDILGDENESKESKVG